MSSLIIWIKECSGSLPSTGSSPCSLPQPNLAQIGSVLFVIHVGWWNKTFYIYEFVKIAPGSFARFKSDQFEFYQHVLIYQKQELVQVKYHIVKCLPGETTVWFDMNKLVPITIWSNPQIFILNSSQIFFWHQRFKKEFTGKCVKNKRITFDAKVLPRTSVTYCNGALMEQCHKPAAVYIWLLNHDENVN